MHHSLGVAFHFKQSEEPRLLDIKRALTYRSRFSECVLFAYIDDAEGTVFAYVDVNFKSRLPVAISRWLCDIFTWQAMRSSRCPFLQRHQQSILSEASWDDSANWDILSDASWVLRRNQQSDSSEASWNNQDDELSRLYFEQSAGFREMGE